MLTTAPAGLLSKRFFPGLMASDTIKKLLPHQKESFLERCREWYRPREAVKQLYQRINLDDPVLQSLSHLKPSAIVNETSSITAAARIASGLPCITTMLNVNAQQIDRQLCANRSNSAM
ncbi:unnamed protein product [Clavelina lepadiformis]|uniref:Uncharacterized protein n=1 Tax=Clavelina lepadiformis TaxID=159417 RepID=A0ABP0FHP7_CLALP